MLLMIQRPIEIFIIVLVMSPLVASCSKTTEESSAAYQAACQGPPLRKVELRNRAREDGYDINHQYDCIDKASFTAVNKQRATWNAVSTQEMVAKRKTELADQQANRNVQPDNNHPLGGAIELFASVKYGMSPAEVLRLLPESKPAATDPRTIDGSKLAVEIESYPFTGKQFHVGFFFLSSRLIQVHLSDTTLMEENVATRNAFERISDTMRQMYGQETVRRLESKWSGLFGEAEWVHDKTKISVDIIPMTQYHSTIVINYWEIDH